MQNRKVREEGAKIAKIFIIRMLTLKLRRCPNVQLRTELRYMDNVYLLVQNFSVINAKPQSARRRRKEIAKIFITR
jgi:hypothetical protein